MTTHAVRSGCLAGFGTVDAEPGDHGRSAVDGVPARTFARFDEGRRDWVWHPGTYTLRAGRSSRDLRLSAQVVMR